MKVREMLEEADVDFKDPQTGEMPLIRAARYGASVVISMLLQSGASVDGQDKQGNSALHVAAFHGHVEVMRELIAHGAAIGSPRKLDGCTPLLLSCHRGHLPAVELLLDHQVDVHFVDCMDSNALHLAAGAGHLDIVRVLIARGANHLSLNKFNCTPLRWAQLHQRRVAA